MVQGMLTRSVLCLQLTRDVARCKPIAQTLDNVETITCDYILDSLVSVAVMCRVAMRSPRPCHAQNKGDPYLSQASRGQHLPSGLLCLRTRVRL